MRRLCLFGVVIVAALSGAAAPHAQTPAPSQRVWSGAWEEHDAWQGRNKFGRSQSQISFVFVQGRDEFGLPRWESRRLTWSAQWEEHIFDHLVIENVGAPDERGAIQNRHPMDIVRTCSGGGTLELGPAVNGAEDDLTPEQKAQLRPAGVTRYQSRDSAVPSPAPTPWQCDALPAPSMPNEDELTGCAYEKSWPKGGRPAGSFSVSVSAPVTAVMEVDPDPTSDYSRFVPVPGRTLIFTASVPSGTARFRFELDSEATSHFPGYATNANVDDAFLAEHALDHYANDGPDVIFHPKYHNAQEWSRVEPLVVETARPQSAAVVTVTTLDYGAVSRLRAFVKSEACGDWQPVPITIGAETREVLAIPMDDDNNLMADALETYRGRDAGVDDDAEPKGNGMVGDGLTAFEEYRGFVIAGLEESENNLQHVYDSGNEGLSDADDSWCEPGRVWHVRTPPRHKDLFVSTPDALYGYLVLHGFAWSSGLSVHIVCPNGLGFASDRLSDPQTRVINFTMQFAGLRNWRGKAVSQSEPQHGVVVYEHDPPTFMSEYPPGLAVGVDPRLIGPPKLTKVVLITFESSVSEKLYALAHELGHAVGIPHHSDSVADWRLVCGTLDIRLALSPLQRSGSSPDVCTAMEAELIDGVVIEPGPLCEGTSSNRLTRDGQFVGCVADKIIRQRQEFSGHYLCPMRYRSRGGQPYYQPQDSQVRYGETFDIGEGPLAVRFDLWRGRVLKYEERAGGAGAFCDTTRGTVPGPALTANIRLLRHDLYGDANRDRPCRDLIVVNDLVARGVQ